MHYIQIWKTQVVSSWHLERVIYITNNLNVSTKSSTEVPFVTVDYAIAQIRRTQGEYVLTTGVKLANSGKTSSCRYTMALNLVSLR